MEKIKIVWSIKSECGPVRKKNEDSVFPDVSGSGFAPFKAGVFDGMGGHKKGEVASELASSVMKEDYSVLLNDKIELQIVLTNEGNVDAYDVVILILVTDEYGETIHEQQSKIDSIGPRESKIFYSDAINIEAGVLHEWFIKLEEVEKEENLNDNLFNIFGFIPPEG